MSLLYYNSYNIFNNPVYKPKLDTIPGGEAFSTYFKIFSQNISGVDRTGSFQIPLDVGILPFMQMPQFTTEHQDFEQICDKRARLLLDQAIASNRRLAVMYSGGIDSTLVLCAILKVAKPEELKNVLVLLSQASIEENPNFFNDHVSKNFECASSYRFPYFLGNDDYLFISGENADQLFGSQVTKAFTQNRPFSYVFESAKAMRGEMVDFFASGCPKENVQYIPQLLDLFEASAAKAPIPIDNVYKLFWWINFTTKWQSVYVRILPYSTNVAGIKLEDNYTTFYHTPEFQLWSLNNTDKFVKDTPDSTKYIAKQYIHDFNKDDSYLSKPKIGSLGHLIMRKTMPFYMDHQMNLGYDFPDQTLFNMENDFVSFL